MTEAKTKSVNMTFPALFSYVMNTNYRSMSGILGLVLSFGAIVMLVIGWNTTSGRQKAIFIIVALMFTVINPLSLAFKTFKQLKTALRISNRLSIHLAMMESVCRRAKNIWIWNGKACTACL